MSLKKSKEIQLFWDKFVELRKDLKHLQNYDFEAWSFGSTKELADELGALVLEGKKTATCSLLKAYEGCENEIPRVGVYSVLCDGDEKPIAIVFLTDTWICRYNEVDERQAYEEGEGDRSLTYWRKVHYEFFSQYKDFHEDDELVCERFKVVHK